MKMAAVLGRTSPDEARNLMLIDGANECLDRIDDTKSGRDSFHSGLVQPFNLDEVALR